MAPPTWLRHKEKEGDGHPEETPGTVTTERDHHQHRSSDARWKPSLVQAIAILLGLLNQGPELMLPAEDIDGLLRSLFLEDPLALPVFEPAARPSGCMGKRQAGVALQHAVIARQAVAACQQRLPVFNSVDHNNTAIVLLNTLAQLIPQAGPTLSSMLPRLIAAIIPLLYEGEVTLDLATPSADTVLRWDQAGDVWRCHVFKCSSLSPGIVTVHVLSVSFLQVTSQLLVKPICSCVASDTKRTPCWNG